MTGWGLSVMIAGIETPVIDAHTSCGTDQFVSTATLGMTLPLPPHIGANARVVIRVLRDGAPLAVPVFVGTFRAPDKNLSIQGNVATLRCEGNGYRATYNLQADIVFAGGARTTPASVVTGPVHIGDDTIAWYADDIPNGTTVSYTATPSADSSFVWVTGKLHGTNSYDTDVSDKKITSWSRLEVWQDGVIIGFAHFPESSEQWSSMLDYTDINNWDDFEIFIACTIVAADGDITFKFVSGRKPGSTARDEYEVRDVEWETAGELPVRAIVRGIMRRQGFGESLDLPMRVSQVTQVGGNLVRLGGNGLVDAGQVRVTRGDSPSRFIQRLGDLFGYRGYDGPDGIWRFAPVRGAPPSTDVRAIFEEGVNMRGVARTEDPYRLFNAVRVEGASGVDQNGTEFAYASQTAEVDIVAYDEIPDPPGVAFLAYSDALLISDDLCDQVREIQEINNARTAVTLTWDCAPVALVPGNVVRVTAPTVDFDGLMWVTSIRHDLTAQGHSASIVGWAGGETAFSETADPDSAELNALPTDPRPANEWRAYVRVAGVA